MYPSDYTQMGFDGRMLINRMLSYQLLVVGAKTILLTIPLAPNGIGPPMKRKTFLVKL
jgi:hypothetical protein